jgi:hypothetical protein
MSSPVKFEYPWCPVNWLIIKSLVHILCDIMSGKLDEAISFKLLVEISLTDGCRLEFIPDEFYLNDLSNLHYY